MIKIEHLYKDYGATAVLTGIDAQFERGRVYGIMGENGAGKTTLFSCIAGLTTFSGTISCTEEPLKERLGYLPTDPFFFKYITGKEYIDMVCAARNVQHQHLAQQNIFDLPLHRYAATYSTGMKKKLALLAILLQGNEYFILDEPFNGVDIQSNMLITAIIHQLKNKGKTVILSSHIFSTLSDTCDEIWIIKEGNIQERVAKPDFDRLEQQMQQDLFHKTIAPLNI
jgi:ABC-2 type transport system ATP-binding protein